MEEEDPIFTDKFYVKKFMEIQQQNIVLYKSLLRIQQNEITFNCVKETLGEEIFKILKDCPA